MPPTLNDLRQAVPLTFDQKMMGVWRAIQRHTSILAQALTLRPGFSPKTYTVTTQPQLVYKSPVDRVILIVNPSASAGLTLSSTMYASEVRGGTGNTQASPMACANYLTCRLFLNITVTGGATNTIKIDMQSRDPVSLEWATSQSDVFGLPFAVGTYYADMGQIGVDVAMGVAYTVAAGTPTWSLGCVLKDGLPGSGSGLSQTVFLAGSDAVNATGGFSLLEGHERAYFVPRDTEIWAVSTGSVTLKILELS